MLQGPQISITIGTMDANGTMDAQGRQMFRDHGYCKDYGECRDYRGTVEDTDDMKKARVSLREKTRARTSNGTMPR